MCDSPQPSTPAAFSFGGGFRSLIGISHVGIRVDPDGVIEKRTRSVSYFWRLRATLGPADDRWLVRLPQEIAQAINFALIHFLASNLH